MSSTKSTAALYASCVSFFMIGLDATVVIPTIGESLDASLNDIGLRPAPMAAIHAWCNRCFS